MKSNVWMVVGWLCIFTAPALAAPPAAVERSAKVEATLKAMSRVPTLADLGTYKDALIACQWDVRKVLEGDVKARTIVVYHWSFVQRQPQDAVQWKVGEQRTLTLRPYEDVPELTQYRRDEGAAESALDLPTFYDTALGTGLPAAMQAAGKPDALYEQASKALAAKADQLKLVGVGDCRVADGFDTGVFYGKTGRNVGLNFGRAGALMAEQEMRLRLAAAQCPKLEWAFWGGGPSRLSGVPEPMIAGQPWPPIAGRSTAPAEAPVELCLAPGVDRGPSRGRPGWAMSVERWGLLENCIREYNRRGLKFMNALILTANAGSTTRIDGMPAETMPVIYERYRSIAKLYPNYCFVERMDIGQSWGLKIKKITPTFILEEWREKYESAKCTPGLMPWSEDPADATVDAAALKAAVVAGSGGTGALVIGDPWGRGLAGGELVNATVPGGGILAAELVLRSAVAAGTAPKRVVWVLNPLDLTAPKAERPIAALAGPAWPAPGGKARNDRAPDQPVPIRLGYGTTVARGPGVWEFGLESYLLFEAALRECERRNIEVLLVLGPNTAKLPARAYEGLADRLRVLSLQYAPVVRFVAPTDLDGKTGPALQSVVGRYLSDTTKGVMAASVPPPR